MIIFRDFIFFPDSKIFYSFASPTCNKMEQTYLSDFLYFNLNSHFLKVSCYEQTTTYTKEVKGDSLSQ
jgi:hypothetical protein